MKTGIEIVKDYDKMKDFRDYEKFKYKKWYSKEEIVNAIVKVKQWEHHDLSQDWEIELIKKLFGDKE